MKGKISVKPLAISVLISLGVGFFAGVINRNSMRSFDLLEKPPLAPPGCAFPIVWTVLYILMGISAYLIYVSDSEAAITALILYVFQLIVNFLWPILFFSFETRLFALLWIHLLWILVFEMVNTFREIYPLAAYLQFPYLIWLTFTVYLNLGVWLLNRK